jgi:hypothetical protein
LLSDLLAAKVNILVDANFGKWQGSYLSAEVSISGYLLVCAHPLQESCKNKKISLFFNL